MSDGALPKGLPPFGELVADLARLGVVIVSSQREANDVRIDAAQRDTAAARARSFEEAQRWAVLILTRYPEFREWLEDSSTSSLAQVRVRL